MFRVPARRCLPCAARRGALHNTGSACRRAPKLASHTMAKLKKQNLLHVQAHPSRRRRLVVEAYAQARERVGVVTWQATDVGHC